MALLMRDSVGCVLGEPLPHLLVGPGPLEGVGIELVVLWHRGQGMPDQLLPSHPGATPEVAAPERTDQHLRLVQPRRMGRREAGPPPAPAPAQVSLRRPCRVAWVSVLNQV